MAGSEEEKEFKERYAKCEVLICNGFPSSWNMKGREGESHQSRNFTKERQIWKETF